MIDNNRLADIKKRMETNATFINPLNDSHAANDIGYLLDLVEQLQKKNEVLSQRTVELTQMMENIKSDFGNNR